MSGAFLNDNVFTFICRFIVRLNRMMKYITSIGQKTGTSKISKNVQNIATTIAFVADSLYRKAGEKNKTIIFIQIVYFIGMKQYKRQ